ncbi:hypothetical protein INT44_008614 [Umbelopsis vinacea]|uniref:Uncharacterized protein n=1 Tax=Umbelopsis vinacea TaxID=44442 RepID=A0A8H7PW98_9FUNG|nr:hypothetical protein INT44_008614 [Umbelopsis vinacea]
MSQTPTTESRPQRRARERMELKAAKRLGSFNSDSKTLSTDSVPTKASLNNKKKYKKLSVSPTKPSFDTQVSSSPGSKISVAVVGSSPCKLIMVESAGAPFVSVEADYSMKVSAVPTRQLEQQQPAEEVFEAPKIVAPKIEAPLVEAPLVEQTPQKENSQEKNGGNSSLVDPTVEDTMMNAPIVTEAEPEKSSEILHSSMVATPETTVIASSPACTDGQAEPPNKSAVTLIGNEESEKPSAPQQQANTPAPTLQTVNTPPVETPRTKSPPHGKKSPNLLDILKEKSKKVSWAKMDGIAL